MLNLIMDEEINISLSSANSSTYVLLITLFLICLYLCMNQTKMIKIGGAPIVSLGSIMSRIINILIIVTLVMGIFTFPILFYAGLFFYVLQNYMFAFMKRI